MSRKIVGVTVGTPTSPSRMAEGIKPVSYGQQDLTEDQKASARQNIGAVGVDENGEVKLPGSNLLISRLEVSDETGDNGFVIEPGENDDEYAVAHLYGVRGDEAVRLNHIAPGHEDSDAVNVAQLNERTEYDGFVDEDISSTLTIETGYFYSKALKKLETSAGDYACTPLIPVTAGDKFKITSTYGYDQVLVAEFNSAKTMVSYNGQIDGSSAEVKDYEYTVPSGVSYIAIGSRYQTTKPMVVKKVVVDTVKHRIAELEKGNPGGGTGKLSKLTFTGAVSAEYDGSEEVEVNIPEGGAGGGAEWELFDTITLEEAVSDFGFGRPNLEGENAFRDKGYKRLLLRITLPKADADSTAAFVIGFNTWGGGQTYSFPSLFVLQKAWENTINVLAEMITDKYTLIRVSRATGEFAIGNKGNDYITDKFSYFRLINNYPAGSTITIWGSKK